MFDKYYDDEEDSMSAEDEPLKLKALFEVTKEEFMRREYNKPLSEYSTTQLKAELRRRKRERR